MTDVFNGYVTKYALTEGIQPKALKVALTGSGMAVEASDSYHRSTFHGEGRDWHRTLDSAIRRAKVMQQGKIASLRRSLGKIETMEFDASLTGKPTKKALTP